MDARLQQLLEDHPELQPDVLCYARLRAGVNRNPKIISTHQVYEMFKFLGTLENEEVHVALVESGGRLSETKMLSSGSSGQSALAIPDILRFALQRNLPGFVLVHNHPGAVEGGSEPSPEDLESFRQLHEAAEIVGLYFVASVIVGVGEYSAVNTMTEPWCVRTWKTERLSESWESPWLGPLSGHMLCAPTPEEMAELGHPVDPEDYPVCCAPKGS